MLTPVLLVVLLVLWGIGRELLHFEDAAAGWVLLGIAVLGVLPILLVVLEGLAAGGGSIEVGKVKVALTAAASAQSLVVVPRNVTQQQNVGGSGSEQIIDALRKARAAKVVVVDLEDGHAWWESRLLILASGAVRLGRPEVIVFTATQGGRRDQFVGWAHPVDLVDRLLQANPDFNSAFQTAMGLADAARIAHSGQLAPPAGAANVLQNKNFIIHPPGAEGLNPFLEEQLLADGLGPTETTPREIGTGRLDDLFDPVLHRSSVDRTDLEAEWFRKALRSADEYVAVTDSGRYVALMTRDDVVSEVLLALTES